MGDEELVQEIPLRPHDLYPIIARLAGAQGAGGDITDLLLDAFFVEFLGREHGDGGFDRAWSHAFGSKGIAARVQDLHGDLAARFMHPLGDDAVVVHVLLADHHRRAMGHGTFAVRPDAAGDHQAHIAPRPCRIELRHAVPVAGFLQPGVHRAHQQPVLQRGKTKVERGKQVGVVGHGFTFLGGLGHCDTIGNGGASHAKRRVICPAHGRSRRGARWRG